jgi:hypothetical protein
MSKKLIRTVVGAALMAAAAVGAVSMAQDPGWGSQTQVVRADPGWGLLQPTVADPGWGVAPAADPGWGSVRA